MIPFAPVAVQAGYNYDTIAESVNLLNNEGKRVINHEIFGDITLSGEYVTERFEMELHDEYGTLLSREYFYVDIPIEEIMLSQYLYEQGYGLEEVNARFFVTQFPANRAIRLGQETGNPVQPTTITLSFASNDLRDLTITANTVLTNTPLTGSGTRLNRGVRMNLTANAGTLLFRMYATNTTNNDGEAFFTRH